MSKESAITREEFEAAYRVACREFDSYSTLRRAIRAFFAALPADVKLTRPVATAEMYATALQKTGNPDGARLWMIMHAASPASLPED